MTSMKVQLFAVARQLASAEFVVVEVDQPPTAAELKALLVIACPELGPWISHCRMAVDHD